jgi:hypothetical protein
MAYALTSDAFQVCISLTNVAGSRKMHTSTNTTMNILYFGNQNVSTIGTLTNKLDKVQSRASSTGMIVGAVIGSILGCCLLLIVVAFFIIFVVTWTKRSVNMNVKRQQSFELLNSPASIHSDQEPIATVSSIDQNEDVEQACPTPSDNPTFVTESVLQDDKHIAVMEATPTIEETKVEPAVEEIMLYFSDDITILEPVLQSVEATTNYTTSEQENIPVQLDA